MKLLLSLVMLFSLSACSFDDDIADQQQKDRTARELEKSKSELSPILGRWEGSIQRGTTATPLEVEIVAEPVRENQQNPDFTAYNPKVFLSSPTDTRFRVSFNGKFSKDAPSDQLILSNSGKNPQAPAGPDDINTMVLTLSNDELTGNLFTTSYVLGFVRLKKISNETTISPINAEDELNEISRQAYNAISGFYYGRVKANKGECVEYNICLNLTTREEPTSTGSQRPYLRGYVYREDITPGSFIGERNLAVNYNFTLPNRRILLQSNLVSTQPGPSSYSISMNLQFSSDYLSLSGNHLVENKDELGTATLRKVNSCPARPPRGLCLKTGN